MALSAPSKPGSVFVNFSLLVSALVSGGASAKTTTEDLLVLGTARGGLDSPKNEAMNAAFGLDRSITDLGRSITPITEVLLDEVGIENLQQLQRLAPNTFSASGFGAPSLPTIRGQQGEIFAMGLRRQAGNNGLGIPLSFNAIGQIDVVRGMPSVMLGTTQRTGGFVYIQPKRPALKASGGSLELSAGEWSKYGAQLDYSHVLEAGRQGIRLSLEHKDEDSFYDYSAHNSTNLFLAYRLLPDSGSQWNVSLEYYDVDWTDNAGINRPTQKLIDQGLYVQGQGVQPDGSTVPGANALVSPTGEVKIDRSRVLTDPLDRNDATTLLLHSTYEAELSDAVQFVNRTYYEHLERDERAQNSFVEIIDGADTFETRSEWHLSADTIVGFNVRYNDVLGYSQFSTEADLPIDLTGPLPNRRIPLTEQQQASLVELRPGVFVSPGGQYDINGDGAGDFSLSDTTDSTSWQSGLFAQHRQTLTERLELTVGVRGDWYDVSAGDPLPPAGEAAANANHHDFLKAGEATLSFQTSSDIRLYATASYSESTSNSMAGGTALGADNRISEQNFATENTLYEMGAKYAPEGSPWYADAAVFDQVRSLRNRDGSNSGIATRGVEAQLFYRGARAWASVGASYLDAQFDQSAAFQAASQVADAFDNSRPDIIQGTGVGAPNFAAFAPSNTRLHGLPDRSLSLAGGYRLSSAWSLGGSAIYTGDYPLDFLQTVTIRDQFTLNANLSYRFNGGRSRVRLDVFNVTNEQNWTPVFEGGFFGSSLVFPERPRFAQLRFSQQF